MSGVEMQGLLISMANDFIKTGGNGRYKRIVEEKSMEDQRDTDTLKCLEYIAATDITFLEGIPIASLLMALRRREAWRTRPLVMIYVTAAQIILCVIMLLSPVAPVNRQTAIFGFIYLGTRFSVNSFSTTRSLVSVIHNFITVLTNSVGVCGGIIIVALMSPLAVPICTFILLLTFLFDWLVGRIYDWSISACVDMAVNALVEMIAMSIGLRSGTAIYAIQSFVGFGFISMMDEALVEMIEFDPYMASKSIHKREHAKCAKLASIIIIYTFVPVVMLIVCYFTFTNQCVLFCEDGMDQAYYFDVPKNLRYAGPQNVGY